MLRPVVLCYNISIHPKILYTLTDTLLNSLQASAVYYLCNQITPIYLTLRMTALIFDVGYLDTTVLAIYGSEVVKRSLQIRNIGFLNIKRHLKSLLKTDNPNVNLNSDAFNDNIIEDIYSRYVVSMAENTIKGLSITDSNIIKLKNNIQKYYFKEGNLKVK